MSKTHKTKEEIIETYSARVSSKGQVVLPKALREEFQFNYGDVIDFEVIKRTTTKKEVRVKKTPTIFELAGTLKPRNKKPIDPVKIREYMEKNYERV